MSEYKYDPRLAVPAQLADIDPLQPAMKVMLKIMARTKAKETSEFVPPEGCVIHKEEITSMYGSVFETWVIEPEKCEDTEHALIDFHGGAFYLPATASSLALACEYAMQMKCRVYLPEYRLIPAVNGYQIFEDCIALYKKVSEEYSGVIVLGESAGGALAAGVCLYAHDQKMKMPKGQLLIYPVLTDNTEIYPSASKYKDAVWPLSANTKMWNAYLRNAKEEYMPYMIPLKQENTADLPEAYIEPQEMDILADEAAVYAEKLRASGIPAELNLIEKSYHGFDSDLASPVTRAAIERRIEAMKRMNDKK